MSSELAVQQEYISAAAGLMSIISGLASNPNVDIDKLQQLLVMQERWEINEDKKSFRESMVRFKENAPKIVKDTHVKFKNSKGDFTEYDHASIGNVCEVIGKALADVGITHAWTTSQEGSNVTVTCTLSFGLYSESTSMTAGQDESGGKNTIQARISTKSYLERHTLTGITGMATNEAEDDGNGLQRTAVENVVEDIASASDKDELQRVFSTAYMLAAKRPEDQKRYKAAYETRKAELTKVKP